MSVKIISDSACDMTQREAKEQGVIIMPLKNIIDGVEYLDGVTISIEEFYEKLENCEKLPSTSQISPMEFTEVLGPIVDAEEEAVIITLAGKLSGTVQSAAPAALKFEDRVWVASRRFFNGLGLSNLVHMQCT